MRGTGARQVAQQHRRMGQPATLIGLQLRATCAGKADEKRHGEDGSRHHGLYTKLMPVKYIPFGGDRLKGAEPIVKFTNIFGPLKLSSVISK